ncbi:hypothetical protein C8Q76DRAFT_724989 [Earliella scabrosa]|nr:hypothetical protein C8Q76DRAFT_724989 [Earliella scabrosa]
MVRVRGVVIAVVTRAVEVGRVMVFVVVVTMMGPPTVSVTVTTPPASVEVSPSVEESVEVSVSVSVSVAVSVSVSVSSCRFDAWRRVATGASVIAVKSDTVPETGWMYVSVTPSGDGYAELDGNSAKLEKTCA